MQHRGTVESSQRLIEVEKVYHFFLTQSSFYYEPFSSFCLITQNGAMIIRHTGARLVQTSVSLRTHEFYSGHTNSTPEFHSNKYEVPKFTNKEIPAEHFYPIFHGGQTCTTGEWKRQMAAVGLSVEEVCAKKRMSQDCERHSLHSVATNETQRRFSICRDGVNTVRSPERVPQNLQANSRRSVRACVPQPGPASTLRTIEEVLEVGTPQEIEGRPIVLCCLDPQVTESFSEDKLWLARTF